MTFAFESLPPNTSPAEKITWPVTRLADHRRHYLDYEGPIAPLQVAGKAFGGSQSIDHRGSVRRLASGTAVCQIAVCQIADSPIRHKAVRQKVVPQMPVPQTSVVPDKRLVRCRLLSPELEAEFDYANCPINRSTELQLRSWQWIALDDTTAVSLR